jgi:hypothetical protein
MAGLARQFVAIVAAATLLIGAQRVAAQAPRAHVGAGLGATLLVGDASDFLDGGGGRFLFTDLRLDGRGVVSLRIDASASGLEDDEDGLSGARAENDLVVISAGPQVNAFLGERWRPYVGVVAGVAATVWRTEVPTSVGDDIEDDGGEAAFAWGAHAGLGFILDQGDHPVGIRVEARLLDAGALPFARAPALSGGAPTEVITEDVGLLELRIAITLGF